MKKTKNEKKKCPICGKYDIPSSDHVPPKCCGNKGKKITYYFFKNSYGKIEQKETQNGVHFEYICSQCNNSILGRNLDDCLKAFYNYVIASNDKNIKWNGNVEKIVKCIFGHVLATSEYSSCVFDKEMREFILKNIIPKRISMYLFYYPYNAIFTIKDAFPIVYFNKDLHRNYICPEKTVVTCLYFHPFAFIISDKNKFEEGVDLIQLIETNQNEIILSRDSWINSTNGIQLPSCWPCMIGDPDEIGTVDAIVKGEGEYTYSYSTDKSS